MVKGDGWQEKRERETENGKKKDRILMRIMEN